MAHTGLLYFANVPENGDLDQVDMSNMIPYDENLTQGFNPNAKWDWWEVGGRFSELLRDSEGICYNMLMASEVSFDLDEDLAESASIVWDWVVEDNPPQDADQRTRPRMSRDWMLKAYGSKEAYVELIATPIAIFNDILAPDGTWISNVNLEDIKSFVKTHPDHLVVAVDYHF